MPFGLCCYVIFFSFDIEKCNKQSILPKKLYSIFLNDFERTFMVAKIQIHLYIPSGNQAKQT